MSFLTILLDNTHIKKDFHCGKPSLDNYLHVQAKQDMKRKLSVCFVVTNDLNKVEGYYTLSNASIPKEWMPEEIERKLPPAYEDIPATLLGRLAVDVTAMGRGIGRDLLIDALKRSYETSKTVGSMAIIVDPLDEDAERFYLKYGFIKLPDSGKMFIPMTTVATLFT
jgi:predicted GNAT family N-acyltransferase